jgi:hypothetical protein
MAMTLQAGRIKLDPRQTIKLLVYTLLLANFVLYIRDDLSIASYTMRNGGSFLEWTAAFATTIDESAWFILLLLFELETYVLSDEIQQRVGVRALVHGVRLLCYLSLLHSIYAFGLIYYDITLVTVIPGTTDLCQFSDSGMSFVRNLTYTDLSSANCGSLSTDTRFYFTDPGLVVTDSSGLALETQLALADIVEVVVWMLILGTIEAMVWLQDRAITRGTIVSAIKVCKFVLYGSLWIIAAYWLSLGHWYFAWDEALWIVGFFAIEMNVSDWKKEIEGRVSQDARPGDVVL